MIRRTLAILLLAGLSLPVAAQEPMKPESTKPAPAGAAEAPAAVPARPPAQVELLDAGKAPLRVLRYTPRVGAKQRIEVQQSMDVKQTLDGNPMPSSKLPQMLMPADVEILSVGSSGEAETRMTYLEPTVSADDPAVPEGVVKAVSQMLKGMKGMTVSTMSRANGEVVKMDVANTANLPPALKDMMSSMSSAMENMSVVLPAEPIGVGAKWRLKRSFEMTGIKVDSDISVTLVEVSDTGAIFEMNVVGVAAKQEVKNPAFPAGTTLVIDKLESKAQGTTSVLLSNPFAVQGKIVSTVNATMSIDVGEGPKVMDQVVNLQITMKRADAASAKAADGPKDGASKPKPEIVPSDKK